MDVRVRCCGLGPNHFAADGSHIGETVVRNYLNSEEYERSMETRECLGYLTHRGRGLTALPDSIGKPELLRKQIGVDDAGLCVGENVPTYTHYVKEFYIENVPGEGPFLCALIHILDEKDFDSLAAENIKRLKGLIKSGVQVPCSMVVLAYWESNGNGIDECKRIKLLKGVDFTKNPSFGPLARITDVYYDDEDTKRGEKTFSIKDSDIRVKTFSSVDEVGVDPEIARSSKIDGKYCILKAKEYSMLADTVQIEEDIERTYSVATIRERVRYAKFSPRMRMRRLFLEYKQAIKQAGGAEKIDPETLKIMKSLFMTDLLDIFKVLTPEILAGKTIATLTGAGSLGKSVRVASQKLQQPARLAYMEMSKRGTLTPMRLKNLQEAYIEFTKAMEEEVFGPNELPEGLEQSIMEEEKNVK